MRGDGKVGGGQVQNVFAHAIRKVAQSVCSPATMIKRNPSRSAIVNR